MGEGFWNMLKARNLIIPTIYSEDWLNIIELRFCKETDSLQHNDFCLTLNRNYQFPFLCDSLNSIILIMGNVMKKRQQASAWRELWNSFVSNSNQLVYLTQRPQEGWKSKKFRENEKKI